MMWLFACGTPSPAGVQFHDSASSKAWIDAHPEAIVLDVRTSGEFAKGHLANAVNLDVRSAGFAEQVKQLDTTKPVIVHCQAGGRSRSALPMVEAAGFTDIHHMDGGYGSWTGAGLPTGP